MQKQRGLLKYKKEIGRLGKLKRIKYELYKDKLILQEEFIKEKIMLDKRIEKIQLDIKGQEHILDKLKEVNILKLGLDKSLTREIAEVFTIRKAKYAVPLVLSMLSQFGQTKNKRVRNLIPTL